MLMVIAILLWLLSLVPLFVLLLSVLAYRYMYTVRKGMYILYVFVYVYVYVHVYVCVYVHVHVSVYMGCKGLMELETIGDVDVLDSPQHAAYFQDVQSHPSWGCHCAYMRRIPGLLERITETR